MKFANTGKKIQLKELLLECQRVGQIVIDDIWNGGIKGFNIDKDELNLPKYIDYKPYSKDTYISAALLQCVANQAMGMISAVSEKRRRKIWFADNLDKEGGCSKFIREKLEKGAFYFSKPNFPVSIEVNSNIIDFIDFQGEFDIFVKVKRLGEEVEPILLPIKKTKGDLKWEEIGKRRSGVIISEHTLQFRYEIKEPTKRTNGSVVGGDQGMKTVLSLADCNGNMIVTDEKCIHGHSLDSICDKITRKKKGSRAFRKAATHRKNFVNHTINKINFDGIKEIRLEKVVNINFGKRVSRKMQSWPSEQIVVKIKAKAEELGVQVTEQPSLFKSQRCSRCGNTRKGNRKAKLYKCKNCSYEIDSDVNSAINNSLDLPKIPFSFIGQGFNLKNGFFWNPDGIKSFEGEELIVPLSKK